MNGLEFLAEKIGRKQLIAIVAMVLLAQMEAYNWQIVIVAMAGIVSQFAIDWKNPRARKDSEKQPAEPK